MNFSQDQLKDILHYDPITGHFRKIKCRRSDMIGKIAGTITLSGYRSISVNNKQYLAHRLAWLYMTGNWPKEVDHINGVKDDNRFTNLRAATASNNMHNQGRRKNNKSGHKGVCYHKGANKWLAQIKINWQSHYLGLFDTPEEAHEAYKRAALKYHREFARFA